MDPGGFPRPGGEETYREAATEEVEHKVVVHLVGGGDIGGGVWANGNLYLTKAEYSRAVYCNAADSGTMQGGREEARGMGGDDVVGIGRTWSGRVKGYISGRGRGGREWAGGLKGGE